MTSLAPARVPVRDVLSTVDRPYLALDTTVRLATAMFPLGILLYVADRTGSFATGGLAVAALSVGGGLGGSLVGMAADRFGHRTVLLLATVAQVLTLGTVLVLDGREPIPLTLLLVALLGVSNPQAGAMARSRWGARARDREDRRPFVSSAMAFEGAVDEMSFVVGPVLVSTVAGLADPALGLVLALVIAVGTQVGFGLHPTALPGRGPTPAGRRGGRPPVPVARLASLMVAMAGVGMVFGVTQTGIAAELSLAGRDELTGPVYAVLGVGSAVMSLVTTRFPVTVTLEARIVGAGLLLVAGGMLTSRADGPLALAAGCLVLGIAVAPAMISAFALAERAAPLGWVTTTMTALSTANVAGVAAGAAVAGLLVDAASPGSALLVDCAAGLLVAGGGVAAVLSRR